MGWTATIQALFAYLITLQFAVVVAHDWIDVPGWTHGTQVQLVVGRRKLWIATLRLHSRRFSGSFCNFHSSRERNSPFGDRCRTNVVSL